MEGDAASVIERELLLLQPHVRQDPARLLSLLHPDFLEFGSSGSVWNRESVASTTADTVAPIETNDVEGHRLGPDAFLVIYKSNDAGRVALRSSTWLREGGEWLLRFHQGTLIGPR